VRKTALLFVVFLGSVLAQNAAPPSATPSYAADCSMVYAPTACRSFNEMVTKKDKDLVSTLASGYTFVCFRSQEDTFVLISYSRPASVLFKKHPTLEYFQREGIVFYDRYKDGVRDDSQMSAGEWAKFDLASENASFGPQEKSAPNAPQSTINDAEVGFAYSFSNIAGTKTDYQIQIRRSTLRFVETYSAPDDPKKGTFSKTTATGYCAEFN
jgi:hypothetical protein